MKRAMVLTLLCAGLAYASREKEAVTSHFYVYADKSDPRNHFIPSGWMGDYGDLRLDDANKEEPADGKTCIKWTYSGRATNGANWAGAFWQNPANNWGDKPGGYDLTGYKRLTFWVKGGKGDEEIAEFKVGGITGEHGDTDAASIGPVRLTKDWKKHTIDLTDKNLSKIVGGFAWSASRDSNPDGFTLYLDEVRFEK